MKRKTRRKAIAKGGRKRRSSRLPGSISSSDRKRIDKARDRLRKGDVSCLLTDATEVTWALDQLLGKKDGRETKGIIQRHDGEGWTQRSGTPFRLVCCDCGLTHEVVICSRRGGWLGIAVRRCKSNKQITNLDPKGN